jgi:hypothetical protein
MSTISGRDEPGVIVLVGVRNPRLVPQGWAAVVVHRPGGHYRDSLRSYEVHLDGFLVGVVKPGRHLVVHTAPGPHRLQGRIDWCSSPVVAVNAEEGRSAYFTMEPNGGFGELVAAILWSPSTYLRLAPVFAP